MERQENVISVLPQYNHIKIQLPQEKRSSWYCGNITAKWKLWFWLRMAHRLQQVKDATIFMQSRWLCKYCLFCLSSLCQTVCMPTHKHGVNMQAKLVLEMRTAPARQQLKQLSGCFSFTGIWLKVCKAQRQQLTCIVTYVPTSEQGWNCSWFPQCLARPTSKVQVNQNRLGAFPWFLTIYCTERLLKRAWHCYQLLKLSLISSWTRYTSFFAVAI